MNTFPTELLVTPNPLVAVVSDLPITEAFAQALRSTNAAAAHASSSPFARLRVETYPASHAFPRKQRSHAHEYESYGVTGILRTGWLDKHHNKLPAVLLLLFEFDPRASAAEWPGVEASLIHAIHEARQMTRDRDASLQVLLLHDGKRSIDERAVSDTLAERQLSLRRKAGLESHGLLLLAAPDVLAPSSPILKGIDTGVRERAWGYYTGHIRRWKRLLPRTTSTAQLPLRARLFFKIAQYNEFRCKPNKALKYYSACYSNCKSLLSGAGGGAPLSSLQIVTVADMCNFKLLHGYVCAGYAPVTTPSGVSGLTGAQAAVMQFQSHTRLISNVHLAAVASGEDEMTPWARHAWVQVAYTIMAELLQLNLPRPSRDTRAQHVPSHYYMTAALAAAARWNAVQVAGVARGYTLLPPGTPVQVGATPVAAAALSVSSSTRVAGPSHMGGYPILTSTGEGVPTPSLPPTSPLSRALCDPDTSIVTSHNVAVEAAHPHVETALALFEKAQALALESSSSRLEPLVVPAGDSNLTWPAIAALLASLDPTPTATSYSRGSVFSYIDLNPTAGRAWRCNAIAGLLWSSGRPHAAARMWVPVAASSYTPMSMRQVVYTDLTRAACVLRNAPLYLVASLHALFKSTDLDADARSALWTQFKSCLDELEPPVVVAQPPSTGGECDPLPRPTPLSATGTSTWTVPPATTSISASVNFNTDIAHAGSSVQVCLTLRTHLPAPHTLTSITIRTSSPDLNICIVHDDTAQVDARSLPTLTASPGSSKELLTRANLDLPPGPSTSHFKLNLTLPCPPPTPFDLNPASALDLSSAAAPAPHGQQTHAPSSRIHISSTCTDLNSMAGVITPLPVDIDTSTRPARYALLATLAATAVQVALHPRLQINVPVTVTQLEPIVRHVAAVSAKSSDGSAGAFPSLQVVPPPQPFTVQVRVGKGVQVVDGDASLAVQVDVTGGEVPHGSILALTAHASHDLSLNSSGVTPVTPVQVHSSAMVAADSTLLWPRGDGVQGVGVTSPSTTLFLRTPNRHCMLALNACITTPTGATTRGAVLYLKVQPPWSMTAHVHVPRATPLLHTQALDVAATVAQRGPVAPIAPALPAPLCEALGIPVAAAVDATTASGDSAVTTLTGTAGEEEAASPPVAEAKVIAAIPTRVAFDTTCSLTLSGVRPIRIRRVAYLASSANVVLCSTRSHLLQALGATGEEGEADDLSVVVQGGTTLVLPLRWRCGAQAGAYALGALQIEYEPISHSSPLQELNRPSVAVLTLPTITALTLPVTARLHAPTSISRSVQPSQALFKLTLSNATASHVALHITAEHAHMVAPPVASMTAVSAAAPPVVGGGAATLANSAAALLRPPPIARASSAPTLGVPAATPAAPSSAPAGHAPPLAVSGPPRTTLTLPPLGTATVAWSLVRAPAARGFVPLPSLRLYAVDLDAAVAGGASAAPGAGTSDGVPILLEPPLMTLTGLTTFLEG